MAINLNIERYGAQFNAFAEFASSHANKDWVVRMEGQKPQQGGAELLCPNGEPRRIVAKDWDGAGNILRLGGSKAVNNDVRSLFKETVLAVCGVKAMEELPPSVLAVMKASDYDGKGHPLTVRRITAVTNAILSAANAEAKSNATPTQPPTASHEEPTSIHQEPTTIREEPATSKQLPSDKVISFKYETPAYIASLPAETANRFMEFYCSAVDLSVENNKTKEQCDETFRDMFRAVGYDKNDRKFLAELLADGKPRFLDADGTVPYREGAVSFAEDLKAVLDKANECRAKLPKEYGNIVADTILGALKTADKMLDADDLRRIDAGVCEKIANVAKQLDTEDLLSVPEDKIRSAKSLNKKLDSFQREASSLAANELFLPGDSEIVVTIKQNLLMCMALVRDGSDTEAFADEIEVRYDDLVERHGKENLLNALAPALEHDAE